MTRLERKVFLSLACVISGLLALHVARGLAEVAPGIAGGFAWCASVLVVGGAVYMGFSFWKDFTEQRDRSTD